MDGFRERMGCGAALRMPRQCRLRRDPRGKKTTEKESTTMKKVSKILAIVLCLAMILSITAVAAWKEYQGNDNHDGHDYIDATPPTGTSVTTATPALNFSGGGWSGVDTTAVMETISGTTYAYVTYNGRSNGTQISKINCNTGTTVWSTQLGTTSANQLSTPYLDTTNGKIYVAATDYYWLLENSEFTSTTGGWTLPSTGATITVGTTPDTSYITINAGKSISQSFTYSASGNARTQLTSRYKLVSGATTDATITYTLTKPDNSTVTLKTVTLDHTKTASFSWDTNFFEALGTNHVSATGSYTITVSVTGANVVIDYVTYSWQTGGIKVVNRSGSIVEENLASATYGGQINTPVMVYGNYLYFGTYNGGHYYYQVYIGASVQNGIQHGATQALKGLDHFYWAGAIRVQRNNTNYILFGGDGGYLYWRTEDSFGGDLSEVTTTDGAEGVYDLSDISGVTAGNIRSSISTDGTNLYFTSQGSNTASYIWKFPVASVGSTVTSVAHLTLTGKTSTSTPAISGTSNKRIFVGYYNGFTSGGVDVIDSGFTTVNSVCAPNPVQCSIAVYTSGDNDYLYFATNASAAAGYCYELGKNSTAATKKWEVSSSTYCLQGMAMCGNYVVFGNDADVLYVVH